MPMLLTAMNAKVRAQVQYCATAMRQLRFEKESFC
jgi:hypothetical protein